MASNIDIFLEPQQSIREITRPLFIDTVATIMNFIRVDKTNKTAVYLCDNSDWIQNYLINQFQNIGAFENQPELRQHEFLLWDALSEQDPIVINSRERFNIRYGLTIIKETSTSFDFFNFGTDSSTNRTREILLRQVDYFHHFCQKFYDQTKRIMTRLDNHAVSIQPNKLPVSKIINPTRQRVYLGPKYNYHYLTVREQEILQRLSKGLGCPEIAELDQCSYRTIEKHIENVKHKLGCNTQFELGMVYCRLFEQ